MSERTSDYYVSPLQVDCTDEEMRLHGPVEGNGNVITLRRVDGGFEVAERSPMMRSIRLVKTDTMRRMARWVLDKTGEES